MQIIKEYYDTSFVAIMEDIVLATAALKSGFSITSKFLKVQLFKKLRFFIFVADFIIYLYNAFNTKGCFTFAGR